MKLPQTPSEFKRVALMALASEIEEDPYIEVVLEEIITVIEQANNAVEYFPTPTQVFAGRMIIAAVKEFCDIY